MKKRAIGAVISMIMVVIKRLFSVETKIKTIRTRLEESYIRTSLQIAQ